MLHDFFSVLAFLLCSGWSHFLRCLGFAGIVSRGILCLDERVRSLRYVTSRTEFISINLRTRHYALVYIVLSPLWGRYTFSYGTAFPGLEGGACRL